MGLSQGLANQTGANATQGLGAQNSLLNALQSQAAGGGPNPAGQDLANATGANVAQTAALLAGQRGTSANPGLIARLGAEQGAGIQQQAIGQEASQRMQQQLAAQQQLASQANTQVGQNANAIQGFNAAAQQPLTDVNAQNASQVSNTSQQNNANEAGYGASANLFGTVVGSGAKAAGMADGGIVPGTDEVGEDSPKNDKVPVMLSPGEIVVPLSFAKNPHAASAFAHAVAMMHSRKDQ